ncbi:MAG: Crp/Fnr family transcriptional regulator [Flavobacteriales bacterium]|nr:Crp/Fnr family transcriptional regulator [Flavobacteriales bacterium]
MGWLRHLRAVDTDFGAISRHLQRCAPLRAGELDRFLENLEPRHVPKRTALLRAGEVCDWEAYVNSGCVRSYFLDEKGHDVTLQFALEDWWVSDLASFTEGSPSRMSIETLEDSELLLIRREQKESLFAEVPALERVFRILVQRNLAALQDRFFATVAQPAPERYAEFLRRHPSLPARVPQHMIASYLGITPEFLSKLRGRIAGKG